MIRSLIFMSVFFIICIPNVTYGSHVTGGEMTYECLGSNQYKIRTTIYYDISNPGQGFPPYDQPAFFTIFKGDGSVYDPDQTLPSYQSVSYDTNIYPQDVNTQLNNNCLIPPSTFLTVQIVYEFTVVLPYDSLGYQVTYQRCCRDNSIVNINAAGSTGMTLTTFISGTAQTTCNSNPVFDESIPTLVCTNEPFQLAFQATDADGDSLVYTFCAPLAGASPFGSQPNLAASPPYTDLAFSNNFSAIQPTGNNMTIDANTGNISGMISLIGKYVVGVCVEEYKNDSLIGLVKRDFILNVADCDIAVKADIEKDSIDINGNYVVNACGTTVKITNMTTQAQFIIGYNWEFKVDSNTVLTSTFVNPTFSFPALDAYEGKLVVNRNSTGDCQDSIPILLHLLPDQGMSVDFIYQYDSTVIAPIQFQTIATSNNAPINEWYWEFGDGMYSDIENAIYQYQDSGVYQVTLTVIDELGCQEDTTKVIEWMPIPILNSTNDFLENRIVNIFPNPAQDVIQLFFNKKIYLQRLDIGLYNLLGQEIITKRTTVSNEVVSLDVRDLPNGTYLVVLRDGDKVESFKVVVWR